MSNRINNRPGGLALAKKFAPEICPKCGKPFPWMTPWHEFLGHLGMHGLADKYFAGNLAATQKHLRENGMARLDPAPWNGAWPKYKKLPTPTKKAHADSAGMGLSLSDHVPTAKVRS